MGKAVALKNITGLPGKLTATSYQLPANLKYEEWAQVGERLSYIEGAVTWWIGDWWAKSEAYGERVDAIKEEEFSLSHQACRNAAWVCGQIDVSRRRDTLSFSHHAEVAKLQPKQQDRWLDKAESEQWSHKELRHQIATKSRLDALAERQKTSGVGSVRVLHGDGVKFLHTMEAQRLADASGFQPFASAQPYRATCLVAGEGGGRLRRGEKS